MNIKDINLKNEYRTGQSNVINEFYIPLLSNAVLYKRAVGFFSSTALIQIAKGIAKLVENGGKIELIASPRLSEEDIEAMQAGFNDRKKIVSDALLRSFTTPQNYFESERLNLLANLIAKGNLDIKIAFTTSLRNYGIYHEKMGLIYDKSNNIVAFSGSTNETESAFVANYEVLDVFRSWGGEFEQNKVSTKEIAFYKLWNDSDDSIETIDFPDVIREKLESYKKDTIDYDIDTKEIKNNSELRRKDEKNCFIVPENIRFYNYQQKAIDSWIGANSCGIFDMATGSGKTYTGLGALSELSKNLEHNLGVIIVCPYQHLVDQWVEDIRGFNVEPLICYSKYDWKKKFKFLLSDFDIGVKKRFCVIISNASYSTEYVQKVVSKTKGNLCIVVDEAHNFGANRMRLCLLDNFKYRLALSATLERKNDEEGTKALYKYFGEKCITYSLADAIKDEFLTPYKYFPVVVTLEEDELEEYNELTEKIVKILRINTNRSKLPESAEMLLIKRARIIAGARNKLTAFYDIIKEYKEDNNMLVYCGATNVFEEWKDCIDAEDRRQIEIITDMLGNKLNMRVSMFTSKEKPNERERIKKSFSEGEMLQALVAIKCLDEGVNIPGIRTAFILASSTNPKEYIQRRGRVLRTAVGKTYAVIYDFVTLPCPLDESSMNANKKSELSLINREMTRMKVFCDLCDNPSETYILLDKISEHYNLNYIGGDEYDY